MAEQVPDRLPVREYEGRWEVLIVIKDMWLACENEADARAIAAAPVLEYESLERIRSGPSFAAELERTATALTKYRMGFGSRFFERRARETRGEAAR